MLLLNYPGVLEPFVNQSLHAALSCILLQLRLLQTLVEIAFETHFYGLVMYLDHFMLVLDLLVFLSVLIDLDQVH